MSFDYLETKYMNINSTGLTYLKTLILDKTYIYLQLYDFTTCDSINLYLGTRFGNPEDIYWGGQIIAGIISLDQKPSYDFIDLKWDTLVLSLKDLDLPMPETLQISRWQNSKVRKIFNSSNSCFKTVAHNPTTKTVRPVTDAYKMKLFLKTFGSGWRTNYFSCTGSSTTNIIVCGCDWWTVHNVFQ